MCFWFDELKSHIEKGKEYKGQWILQKTKENCSLLAKTEDGRKLILIAGRQMITKENLEFLALVTNEKFDNGKPIKDLIIEVLKAESIPVIPWGVGKWLVKFPVPAAMC